MLATGEVPKPKSLSLAEVLGAKIVRNAIPATAHLPTERDLAAEHRTSRVTIRESIAKLVEWGLLRVRRGSGMVVRERSSWSFAALPLAIRAIDEPSARQAVIRDLLALRRALVLHGTRVAAGRVKRGSLGTARAAVAHANEERSLAAFVAADIEIMRNVLTSAELWPQLWLINDMMQGYPELALHTWPSPRVPDDYVDVHEEYFDAVEAGDAGRACAVLEDYLVRLDTILCESLGMSLEGT